MRCDLCLSLLLSIHFLTNLSLFLGFNDDDARFNIEDSVVVQQQQPHTHTHAFFVCGGAVYVKKTASIVYVPYTPVWWRVETHNAHTLAAHYTCTHHTHTHAHTHT